MPYRYLVEKDEEVRAEILQRIKTKWIESSTRDPFEIHLSDLIYCPTFKYWQGLMKFNPTDQQVMYWVVGLGLERILLEDTDITNRPDSKQVDDIWVSPDYLMLNEEDLTELKSTRQYLNKEEEPTYGWPDTWIQQMMGYCYVWGRQTYRLAGMFIIPAKLIGRKFTFYTEDLKEFWNYILDRKAVLQEAWKQQLPPEPFAYAEDWMCKRCPAQMMCDSYKRLGKYVPKEIE